MYTATVTISEILDPFYKTNGVFGNPSIIEPYLTVNATLIDTTPLPIPPPKSPPGSIFQPEMNGQALIGITMNPPKDYNGLVRLTFVLQSSDYVLLGIAFVPDPLLLQGEKVGRHAFPSSEIFRDDMGSQMIVTAQCGKYFNYSFGVLIQKVDGGHFGIWDPDIENDQDPP